MAEANTNQQGTAPENNAPQTPQTQTQTTNQQGGTNYDEIFAKLDQILDKRSEGLAKSALKDNGVADEEIKDIVTAWRTQRQAKTQETTNVLTQAQAENEALKAKIAEMAITTAAQAQAVKMGIDAASLPYVTKLADFSGVLNEKGEADPEKINAALQKVIDDVPAFQKTAADEKGFVKIGGSGGTDETANEAEAKLRRAFGLK